MYKSICVLVVLQTAFVFTSGSKPADATPAAPVGPAIIAHVKLVNQTAPIPSTTIFTPSQNGLYRLSAYATITTPAQSDSSYWTFSFDWTDDSGQTAFGGNGVLYPTSGNGVAGPFGWANVAGFGPTIVFEAKAGLPVTYSMTLNGPADASVYALYFTVERLE
jgi:hypothetical protein